MAVDVEWLVVWLSVRLKCAVVKVEGDVEEVDDFLVCLYGDLKSEAIKDFY